MLHYHKVLTVVFASGVASVLSVPVSLPVSEHGAVSTSDARQNAVTGSGMAVTLSIPGQLGLPTEVSQPILVARAQKNWATIHRELTARYGPQTVDSSQSIEALAVSLESSVISDKVTEFTKTQPHQPYWQEQTVKQLLGWLQLDPHDSDLQSYIIHVVDEFINASRGHGTNHHHDDSMNNLTNNMGALNFEGDPSSGSGSGSGSRPAGRR